MLFLGKILMAPFYGIYKIFEEVHAAVQQEQQQEVEDLKQQLMSLYRLLETDVITEEEFVQQEAILLEKLDKLKRNDSSLDGGG